MSSLRLQLYPLPASPQQLFTGLACSPYVVARR